MSVAVTQPQRYRKRPVVVEAFQWDGTEKDARELIVWANTFGQGENVDFLPFETVSDDGLNALVDPHLLIHTLEGEMWAKPCDYIIRGVHSEIYPCDPEIFSRTYEMISGDWLAN